ncbi:unnamed protein product, partial [Closterium sp. Naga37s-1]
SFMPRLATRPRRIYMGRLKWLGLRCACAGITTGVKPDNGLASPRLAFWNGASHLPLHRCQRRRCRVHGPASSIRSLPPLHSQTHQQSLISTV